MVISLVGDLYKQDIVKLIIVLLQFSGDVTLLTHDELIISMANTDDDGDLYIGNVNITSDEKFIVDITSDVQSIKYPDFTITESISESTNVVISLGSEEISEDYTEFDVINIIDLKTKNLSKETLKIAPLKEVEEWFNRCITDKVLHPLKPTSNTCKIIKVLEKYTNIPLKSSLAILKRGIM